MHYIYINIITYVYTYINIQIIFNIYIYIYIYIKSFSEVVFPDCFKIDKVIPLHKKNNTNILDNFRPLYFLPQFSKMY